MATRNVVAIVLHRIHLGEADRLLTVLTREEGKVSAVAKGSRRPGGKLAGASELFTHSEMQLASGRSLDIVTQCQVQSSFMGLRADLGLLARASYLCELVDRLTEERQPHPEAFDLLLSGLHLLSRPGSPSDTLVHAFELRLLADLGYAPALDLCVRCGGSLPRGRCGFSPSLGGALCALCRFSAVDSIGVAAGTLDAMRELLNGPVEKLIATVLPSTTREEIARCTRWYIRYRCDRDLKSLEFLDQVRTTERGAGQP